MLIATRDNGAIVFRFNSQQQSDVIRFLTRMVEIRWRFLRFEGWLDWEREREDNLSSRLNPVIRLNWICRVVRRSSRSETGTLCVACEGGGLRNRLCHSRAKLAHSWPLVLKAGPQRESFGTPLSSTDCTCIRKPNCSRLGSTLVNLLFYQTRACPL